MTSLITVNKNNLCHVAFINAISKVLISSLYKYCRNDNKQES